MTEHETEYVSVPRLKVLARELEILNKKLIAEGVSSTARIRRLRHFATTTLDHVRPFVGHIERKGVVPGRKEGTWRAQIVASGKCRAIGTYDTPEQAHEAYKRAHAEKFGTDSPHHLGFIGTNNGDYMFGIDDDGNSQPLPRGCYEQSGKFYARRYHMKERIIVGPFVTVEEAEEASLAAAIEIEASIAQKAAA